jgi:hypothetical protein
MELIKVLLKLNNYIIFLFVYNIMNTRKRIGGKWSLKYKKSINCRHPKGFSQRQHCKYGRPKMNKKKGTRKNK